MRRVSSWGRLSALPHEVIELADRSRVAAELVRGRPGIAYGLGRSYGDACLNPDGVLWRTAGLDRFIRFDEASGRLVCEAGVVLRDIQRLVLPRGWGLPVLPGTQFVTVGGAIANDVHGKNHHETGTFGDHVKSLRLLRTDGQEIVCGPTERPDWFAATVGGLGLTGLIVEAELQLRPVPGPWLDTETIAYAGLDEFFRLSEESHPAWEHAVSWIDCTSGDAVRGLFMRAKPAAGEHGTWRERRLVIPVVPPVSLVNRLTLKPLNQLYWTMNKRRLGQRIAHYGRPVPLDGIRDWNRLYGPAGFYQYQCVVPREAGSPSARCWGRSHDRGWFGAGGAEDLRRSLPAALSGAGVTRPLNAPHWFFRWLATWLQPWPLYPAKMRAPRSCSKQAIRASANFQVTVIRA
jgi:FAD/FMN-containing dehydrogenase